MEETSPQPDVTVMPLDPTVAATVRTVQAVEAARSTNEERPSLFVLLVYSLGQWLGRRRLVAAFMLGLDAGVHERAYHNVTGRWPKVEISQEQLEAVTESICAQAAQKS